MKFSKELSRRICFAFGIYIKLADILLLNLLTTITLIQIITVGTPTHSSVQ